MNNSDDKVRLRITSPTLDESDDFSSLTKGFGETSKTSHYQINGGSRHSSGPQRIDREDSPTER